MSEVITQWQLYICRACGLIYDEREGDPDSGLAPGTRFDDIPDDWECPLCGVTKSDFEPFERPVITGSAPVAAQHKIGIIIIGAGIAGWAMAEAIRRIDANVPISLITACPGDVYHKPELSLAIARGQRAKELIRETGIDCAARLRVNLLPHTFVMGVCSVTKTVRTTRGTFGYHNLVLAQGAKAREHEKIPAEWSWRVNHLSSWSGLQQRLQAGPGRVAIIGGGLVGCELAENLCRAGHQVEFIFRSSLLPTLLPAQVGQRLQTQLLTLGVNCYGDAELQTVEQVSDKYQLELTTASGEQERVLVDHIITATGLETDNRIARMAGLEFNNGISVDAQILTTSKPDIYALGDCISLAGNACRFIAPIDAQAKVIATQIAGEHTSVNQALYRHQPPTIRVKVQSCSLVVRGQPLAHGHWQTLVDDGHQLTMEQYSNGELVSRIEYANAS